VSDFKKLKVWHYSHALALDTYRVATLIRGNQHTALRSQMIRASASIPANIVEGRAKTTEADFARFLGYAIGSAAELEYHVLLGRDISVISAKDAVALLSQLKEIRKMLHTLRARLKSA
jgi:four helix bundle protein